MKDLEYIRESLERDIPKNLSFFGLRRVGKMELLKYALCDIIKDNTIVPVHGDLSYTTRN